MRAPTRHLVALVVCAGALASSSGRALAHTELEFSLPANGTTVGEPVSEISVGFTDQVALVGNGFEVHDPQGNLLTPFVVTDDNMEFRFQLDPPLAGGVVVVDYHVRALDGDVQEGSFSFTVAAALPTSTTSTPTTSPPDTTLPTSTTPATPAASTTDPAAVAVPPTTAPPTTAPATAPASTLPGDESDGSERTLTYLLLLGVAVVAAGFVLVRSRRRAPGG